MSEIVSLEEYREAKRIVVERALSRKWIGPRFLDLQYFDWFCIPSVCGGRESLYIKVEDNEAMLLPPDIELLTTTCYVTGEPIRFCGDMPVLEYRDYR